MFKKIVVVLTTLSIPLFVGGVVLAQQLDYSQNKTVVLPKDEIVDKDYFAAGETVTISGTVNGDAYIAGGTVNIEGEINGDLFAAGGVVNLGGTITNDARVAGGEVTISSQINGNLTALGGNVNITDAANIEGSLVSGSGNLSIFAPIGKGLTVGSGNVTLGDTVGGDITAGVGQLTLTPNAQVSGDLTYWSDQDAQVQAGAQITGQTTHNIPPKPSKDQPKKAIASTAIAFKIISFVSALIFGLILIKFLPVFASETKKIIGQKLLVSLGVGFLALVLTPIAFIVLLLPVVTIPLALILVVGFLITLYLAKIFVAMWAGHRISKIFNLKTGNYSTFLLGLVVIYIITLIPFIGWLVWLLVVLTGTGGVVLTKFNFYKQLRSKNLL